MLSPDQSCEREPGQTHEREKVRQAYRTGVQWKLLIVSLILAVIAMTIVAVLTIG